MKIFDWIRWITLMMAGMSFSWAEDVSEDLCQYNQLVIESTSFKGLEVTKPWVVTRELRQGSTFDCGTWIREKNELESLGIFAEVALLIHKDNDKVQLEYQFKELLAWLPIPAMKQSDQAGLMLGPGLAAVNLLGRDIFVQAFYRTDVTPKFNTTEEFLINTQGNYLYDLPLWWNFAWVKVQAFNELKEYNENSQDINLVLRYLVWKELEVVSWSGAFLVDRDTTAGFTRTMGMSKSPWVGLGFRWDGVDNLTDPKHGLYSEVLYRQFGEKLGGSVESDFSEWLSDQQFYFSPIGDNHTWIFTNLVRWRQGRIPFYESLEPGGANSFRPWLPGPERSGESEQLGTFEYRWTMVPKTLYNFPILNVPSYWGLQPVVGFDVVNIWSQDSRNNQNAYGYYAGVHLVVPAINRIRFEIANEINRNNWVLQIGVFEKTIPQRWRLR